MSIIQRMSEFSLISGVDVGCWLMAWIFIIVYFFLLQSHQSTLPPTVAKSKLSKLSRDKKQCFNNAVSSLCPALCRPFCGPVREDDAAGRLR